MSPAVSPCRCHPVPVPQSFREELESLIQEQMKKGNNSSHVWALRQIADFMATTSPATLPTSPMGTWGPLGTRGGVGKTPKPGGHQILATLEPPNLTKTFGTFRGSGTTKPLRPEDPKNLWGHQTFETTKLWGPLNF